MSRGWILAGLVASAALAAGPASADDWKANAARMDAEMKAFDKRQSFKMEEACKAEYAIVSPNRKDVSHVKVDLGKVNGESIENGAGSYTEPFNYSQVSYDCHRGPGKPNCTSTTVSFGYLAVRPGSEPAFCKLLVSAIATCQGVASFKPSKRGCEMLQWEKDFVKNGPTPKPKSRFGM